MREDPNKQNKNERGEITTDITEIQNMIREYNEVICQQIRQPKKNGQIFRNIQPSNTESRRNRQSQQTEH